ncbi:hypothetical protein DBV15_01891 [Temnothorax longispinosus]|uniref:Uncharacterized protein n=1 Tax=Temnothorax longispinosus TaxID=300112 RepID=A0A4S2L2Z4_9HYME|nr:hypothetical protein DBV15_01891 [Temnothorax longispinosus]
MCDSSFTETLCGIQGMTSTSPSRISTSLVRPEYHWLKPGHSRLETSQMGPSRASTENPDFQGTAKCYGTRY